MRWTSANTSLDISHSSASWATTVHRRRRQSSTTTSASSKPRSNKSFPERTEKWLFSRRHKFQIHHRHSQVYTLVWNQSMVLSLRHCTALGADMWCVSSKVLNSARMYLYGKQRSLNGLTFVAYAFIL